MRAIIFLLFVVLVFLIIRFTLNRIIEMREKQRLEEEKKQQNQDDSVKDNVQEIVRCAESGVHIPKSEAFFDGKDYFSSEESMRRFHAKNTP